MARRTLNRKDLRADFEAAERRKQEQENEEDEDEDEDEDEEVAESEEEEDEGEEEEEAPAPVKKKKKAPPKEPKPKRTRTKAVVRQRLVWGVFNNSNQRVATFDYPKKQEAEDHAAKLQADKKSTFFVQPVKEAIEEKKE